jgi:quercetin dioxygenase-like cupin family protein
MQAPDGRMVRIGDLQLRFLVDDTESAGKAVIFEFAVPPQARVPAPHYHQDVDEVLYGLEGTLTTTVDGQKHALTTGEAVFIPRGSVHHHENLHQDNARALCVMTPGSIGRRYFEEVAREVNVAGKPDLAKVKEIMLRHGLVPV